jgi:hypothetical protein
METAAVHRYGRPMFRCSGCGCHGPNGPSTLWSKSCTGLHPNAADCGGMPSPLILRWPGTRYRFAPLPHRASVRPPGHGRRQYHRQLQRAFLTFSRICCTSTNVPVSEASGDSRNDGRCPPASNPEAIITSRPALSKAIASSSVVALPMSLMPCFLKSSRIV